MKERYPDLRRVTSKYRSTSSPWPPSPGQEKGEYYCGGHPHVPRHPPQADRPCNPFLTFAARTILPALDPNRFDFTPTRKQLSLNLNTYTKGVGAGVCFAKTTFLKRPCARLSKHCAGCPVPDSREFPRHVHVRFAFSHLEEAMFGLMRPADASHVGTPRSHPSHVSWHQVPEELPYPARGRITW